MRLMVLCSMLAVSSVAAQSRHAQDSAAAAITPTEIMRRVAIIADDSMMGRGTPSRGLELTAAYVASEFRRSGLRPGGDDGSYLQRFRISRWVVDPARASLQFTAGATNATARFGKDAR